MVSVTIFLVLRLLNRYSKLLQKKEEKEEVQQQYLNAISWAVGLEDDKENNRPLYEKLV